ncbi:flagellin N-terminal helical domain-containing protein [Stygiobacter electus]|uniref:Flagellin n=1 Tax=Stygiobacter electus TaxID=3032292 RepID=A0AAE3P1C8_9BACT|nr:flagellin [Stygiobacter electus]MDF1611228.1 flagellin [Stygiobacter electus]
MRVTEGLITDKYLFTNSKIAEKKLKLQTQLTTNSKFENMSDDIAGSLKAIKLDSLIKKTDTFIVNTKNGIEFLQASISSLDQMTNQIQNVMKLATDAGNPLNKDSYTTIAQSIKSSLSAIVQLVNEKHNDMYLFGGTNFSEDVATIDSNGKAVKSTANRSGEIKVRISNNAKESINISGNQILDSGIFESINNVIDQLESGNAPTKAQLDDLDNAYKNILNVQSLAGEKYNKFTNMQELLTTYKTQYNEMLVNVQSIDPAQIMVELQQQDYLLQVSYKLLSNTFSKSVFDYL